jgi:hypothetical protein
MNFFSSRDFLDVCSSVYFKNRSTSIEEVSVGEHVLRLLVVDNAQIITRTEFLDYHEPLASEKCTQPSRRVDWVENVACATVECTDHHKRTFIGYTCAPFVEWGLFPSFDSYWRFARHRSKEIRELDRHRRKFEREIGPLVFKPNDYEQDVIDFAVRWKRNHLRSTGRRDCFRDPRNIEFFHALRHKDLLMASTLRLGNSKGRLLAASLGYIYDNSWSGWIQGYDNSDFKLKSRPFGRLLVAAMLEESYRRKHARFDFSTGSDDWKWAFVTHARLLGDVGTIPMQRILVKNMRKGLHHLLSGNPRTLDNIRRAWAVVSDPLGLGR